MLRSLLSVIVSAASGAIIGLLGAIVAAVTFGLPQSPQPPGDLVFGLGTGLVLGLVGGVARIAGMRMGGVRAAELPTALPAASPASLGPLITSAILVALALALLGGGVVALGTRAASFGQALGGVALAGIGYAVAVGLLHAHLSRAGVVLRGIAEAGWGSLWGVTLGLGFGLAVTYIVGSMPAEFCGGLCSFENWEGLQTGLLDGVLYGFLFGLTASVALELGLLAQLASAQPVGQPALPVTPAQEPLSADIPTPQSIRAAR